jgi:DNA-binding NtrC family response regulator
MSDYSTVIAELRPILILSISPFSEDHLRLKNIFGNADFKFVLNTSHTLASAATELQRQQFAVVICEYDLLPGSWKDVLAITSELPLAPSLIVSSRLADERKWAEALDLGAYDLLAKPFHAKEVCRVVNAAWSHWHQQHKRRTEAPQLYRNASGL